MPVIVSRYLGSLLKLLSRLSPFPQPFSTLRFPLQSPTFYNNSGVKFTLSSLLMILSWKALLCSVHSQLIVSNLLETAFMLI